MIINKISNFLSLDALASALFVENVAQKPTKVQRTVTV